MRILFVCSGNICRSPMAEGIARHHYGDKATFASAGTVAMQGSTPTAEAVAAAEEIGVDISGLRAMALTRATEPPPDRIYVMTARHHDQVTQALPDLAPRVELLDAAGDVADPYGMDLDVYRRTRDHIAAALHSRAADWD